MLNSGGDVFDTLMSSISSIGNELSRYAQSLGDYSQDAADKLEKGFDSYADSIRQAMRQTSWVPDSMKPPAPPPPRAIPVGIFARCTDWIDNHRAISAAVVGFAGTTAFLIYRHRKLSRRKRRARRAPTGAKTEVVVLAGSPFAHITKSLALDLEKRGFLVYIPVGTLDEEAAVAELRVTNIHALNFDITSPESTTEMLEKFVHLLYHPQRHGTDRLHMAALVVLEGSTGTLDPQPTHMISTSKWSDALNTRVLYPISLTQTFLPLLVSESRISTIAEPTSLVFLTSSNVSSINAPTHAQESTTTAAFVSYIATLRAEIPKSLRLTHLRLGSLALQAQPVTRLDMALTRIRKFAPSSSSSTSSSPSRHAPKNEDLFPQTSELRRLQHGVFDAVVGRTRGLVFLGRGALIYSIFGTVAPGPLVSWMMGYQRNGYDLDVQQILNRPKTKSLSSSAEWEGISASIHTDVEGH